MKVVVQIVDDNEDVLGEGSFKLAGAAVEPILTNTLYKMNLECDRAALEASASLLLALHPELRMIRR